MKWKFATLCTVLALAAFTGAMADNPGNPRNPIVCEPVLTFDISGAGMLGPCHKHLSVYNNGRVSLAQFMPDQPARNESRMIPVTEVRRLVRQLSRCERLEDAPMIVLDVPMTTVTVFRGFDDLTDARAHSFSYWIPIGDYREVQQMIDDFIRQAFPEPPRQRSGIPYR